MKIEHLPVQKAARVYLGSISYSNPLPHWHDLVAVPVNEVTRALRERIRQYWDGTASVVPPFRISIPCGSAG